MNQLHTPSTLAEEPSTDTCDMPDYDWNKQTRHETIIAGKYTANTIRTFDAKGRPTDARAEYTDPS